MATLDILPSTVYTPPPPAVQEHRRRRSLNTIMEDDENASRRASVVGEYREAQKESLADWRSPLSDHFPTPRGNHFMSAPYIPPSPSSASESEYSQTSSAPWTRNSYGTQASDFDDLYDVSSGEEDNKRKSASLARTSSVRKSSTVNRLSTASTTSRRSLPSLVIPESPKWAPGPQFKFLSPIPPTPPPKVPMSPAVFQYLSTRDIPSLSTTPSLDGSYTSEQMAAMSAPPTPNIGNDDSAATDNWGGVQLQPAAMATLQALSGDDHYDQAVEQVIEVAPMSPTREMQQSPPPLHSAIRRHDSIVLPPDQQRSLNCLSRLDIPSPGGFFSNLSPNSRNTWHFGSIATESEVPPSSTTAEHFYKTPWMTNSPIERIVEVSEVMSDGCSTARPTFRQQGSDETITGFASPEPSLEEEIVATEILDYDDGYVRQLEDVGSEHLDRTSMWLSAQTTYLSALINPPEERDDEAALEKRDAELAAQAVVNLEKQVSPLKKTVRFSEFITNETKQAVGAALPKMQRQESAYYRAFLQFVTASRYRDTFVHQLPRFEALQTQRINFPEAHRNQLLGKYQLSVVPQSAKKRMSSNVARGDEMTIEDPAKLKADKDREAHEQMSGAAWNVNAMKMLNGGRLIAAPVAKRLARLTSMGPSSNRERARILDLGGQGSCDWAWHCAFEYPNAKVYTLTTKNLRQLSNSNIRGPKNHRQVAVEKMTKLPFADNQFDLISARHLYSILKVSSENGEDEYDACLAECMRVLKPGGYLEFNIMDSDIVNAGSRGQAKSVEFGFSLKTRGYDPTPTKGWISRLQKAGFVSTKRAWLFLPMGAPLHPAPASRDSMGVEVKLELEAMLTGSTEAIACVTGLLGAWAWERWMLKLQMESGCLEGRLLDGVSAIVEEGRNCSAGWRTLNGWTRKPLH